MSSGIPLQFLYSLPAPPKGSSLGDLIAHTVTDNGRVSTLLDCIPSTDSPAIFTPDTTQPPLTHRALRAFIAAFCLPCSPSRTPLGPNDRVMVVLPTSPENATALLSLAAYHTTAPVNASCTAAELREDAERLGARAVFATRDAEDRLELRALQAELGLEVVYMEARVGETGLFDMSLLDETDESTLGGHEALGTPSALHTLGDYSLVLHTSGTSGKKKVVPYTLRSLIVGTCAVIISWDLRHEDVNSESGSSSGPGLHILNRRCSEHDAAFPCWRDRPQPPCTHHVWWISHHVRRI
jgi:acyl-CoA synthetase (AMP-forming)/AMP-acid ligase II